MPFLRVVASSNYPLKRTAQDLDHEARVPQKSVTLLCGSVVACDIVSAPLVVAENIFLMHFFSYRCQPHARTRAGVCP